MKMVNQNLYHHHLPADAEDADLLLICFLFQQAHQKLLICENEQPKHNKYASND